MSDGVVQQMLRDDPWEWRALWLSGLSALDAADVAAARSSFNAVYGQVPGELAPKLALALACELSGEADVAEALYLTCARTDANYTAPAAFGLNRLRQARGDVDGAIAALDLVPSTSRAFVEARRQRAGLLASAGRGLPGLAAALDSVAAVTIEPMDRARLEVDVLEAALGEVLSGGPQPDVAVGGVPAQENPLRDAVEAAYRRLATMEPDLGRRVALVDRGELDAEVDVALTCPQCGALAAPDERFCETCGAALTDRERRRADPAAETAPPPPPSAPEAAATHEGTLLDDASQDATDMSRYSPIRTADADLTALPALCANCSGTVAEDGYCEQCGAAAPRRRDHWVEQPATWLAAVCDRGVRHTRNEDAMAVAAAADPGSLGALVVCDGVSMAPGSDVASLAAARAARDALVTGLRLRASVRPGRRTTRGPGLRPHRPDGPGTGQQTARAGELAARIIAAGAAAQEQAAAAGADVVDGSSPPSCTFVAALLERGAADGPGRARGRLGRGQPGLLAAGRRARRSRSARTTPGPPRRWTHGVPRAEAERMPQSHAITRWLGADAPDPVPHTAVVALDQPGWVMLCSDGLWNYCSDPAELSALVERTVAGRAGEPSRGADRAVDPAALVEALVAWAVEQGGHDNITVALARFDPVAAVASGCPVSPPRRVGRPPWTASTPRRHGAGGAGTGGCLVRRAQLSIGSQRARDGAAGRCAAGADACTEE